MRVSLLEQKRQLDDGGKFQAVVQNPPTLAKDGGKSFGSEAGEKGFGSEAGEKLSMISSVKKKNHNRLRHGQMRAASGGAPRISIGSRLIAGVDGLSPK